MSRKTETGGIADSKFYGAKIVTARIINVNIDDYTVDVIAELSGQPWFDIQVSSPYLHYYSGEGIYVMPEVGAVCWVCIPSSGRMAPPFVLGFQAAVDLREPVETENISTTMSFSANRPALNPGDMLMKTRDENFLILRRGGVVQIGSTPIAQRIFLPVGNMIRDVCENYLLESLAGQMEWKVERVDQADPWNENPETRDPSRAQDVLTSFSLRSKTNAAEREHSVVLRTGSHADDQALRLSLVINSTGDLAPGTDVSVIQMQMTKDGNVSWGVKGTWGIVADRHVSIGSNGGDVDIFSQEGEMTLHSKIKTAIDSSLVSVSGSNGITLSTPEAQCLVEAKEVQLKGKVRLIGPGPTPEEPIVKGEALVALLRELIDGLSNPKNPSCPAAPQPGLPVIHTGAAKLLTQLNRILSKTHTTT